MLETGGATASEVDATVALKSDQTRRRLALGLVAASGFAALGYQIVWTQQSALWLGHESAAVLAVVAAFFGGLGAGAFMLSVRIDRSSRPGYWYAACEAVIGLWSLVLTFLMAPVTAWFVNLCGAQPSSMWQWAIAFCGTFLLLLPATAAMGATLPAMERVFAQMRRQGASIGALYAANTLGAVLGVLFGAFWLVPEFGLSRTTAVCIVLNFVCAAMALRLFAVPRLGESTITASAAPGVLIVLAATGLLGIGYEVLVVRVLSQVAENTVFTYAMLLAVYLVGTALGASAYQRWSSASFVTERLGDQLLCILSAVCVLGTASLAASEILKSAVLHTLGHSMAAALAAEAALGVVAFLLPTVLMGALFSHLSSTARTRGIRFGRALAVNTLGAMSAPLLFGVMFAPALGLKLALLFVACGYLVLSARRAWSTPMFWGTAAAAFALAIWGPSLRFVEVPEGGHIVSYKDGVNDSVSVVEDADGVARLRINNRAQEGSSATLLADARQALLPLLLHPSPRHALFLGLGTGVTATSAAEDPMLEVDAVELLPEVVEASAYFRRSFDSKEPNPRLHIVTADGRRFVRATRQRYDLIVSDNFHPARSGSGSLYTVEHFEAVRERLAAGGIFCQWLPLHQLDLGTLRSIVRAFIAAYPLGSAMLATNSLDTPVIGLISRGDGQRFDVAQVRARLASVAMPRSPAEFGIGDDLALFGSFIAGPRALAAFGGNGPLNTDDRPVVAYRAPRATYVPVSLPRDRLIAVLREVDISPDELVATPHEKAWASRLKAYWAARDRFIEVGRDIRPTSDVRAMLAQVREPLLSVLHISPDFQPAYDPLLRMATALGRSDVAGSRALLAELQQAQPSRPEAARILRDLSRVSP